jgi:hypothetical protein
MGKEKRMDKNIIKVVNDWNPIEIYPLLEDEYLEEIKKILDFIEMNKIISHEELTIFLEKVFKDSFGENLFFSSKEKCIEVAKKILYK